MRFVITFLSLVYLLVVGWHFGQIALGVRVEGSIGLLRELTLYFFLPAPFLLVLALVLRARVAIALSLLPIALFVLMFGPRFAPQGEVAASPPKLRVLTFNAGAGVGADSAEALLSAVQAAQADVVALQEVSAETLVALRPSLGAIYPYRVGTPDAATLSMYPLLDPIEFHLPEAGYLSQAVDIQIEDRLVRLTNVHLQRAGPRIGGGRSVAAFVRDYEPELVDSQISVLVERYIRPVAGSQLLTGDFNQTEWTAPYERIASVLRDSFREAGAGFGHTYPSRIDVGRTRLQIPLVRIDYIFHSADLVALGARVGPHSGSDHLPVVADLAFR